MRPRPEPLRSCAACGVKRPKRQLIRIVRTPLGTVEVDPSGKRAGRGAYLCVHLACWEQGLKKSRLDFVLHHPLAPADRQHLKEFAQGLVRES